MHDQDINQSYGGKWQNYPNKQFKGGYDSITANDMKPCLTPHYDI